MPEISILHGPRITLRPVRPEDVAARLRYGRDPEFHRMCGGDPDDCKPLTEEDVQRWFEHFSQEPFGWTIEYEGRLIGTARLHSHNSQDRRARYAIGIYDPSVWGRGLGTETTRLVLGYAFDVLGLHRVDLRVLEYNHRAIACYEKCGFRREGIERESALIGGRWYNDVMMSILEHEYRSPG
ncbi:MAG TPA: GNAT family N-acetyltransferase [Chloroflexi bacterium]|jgi:ribosomal-protein-alanine N-acetyltransferase|nr:GNAT family N-acetyltransferase [Chloroflexota bacterium]